MGNTKKAAQKKQTATPADDGVEAAGAQAAAKGMFVNAVFDMGWRMALVVIIPVFVGVQIDQRFDTAPSATLAALFIAVAGAVYVVARTINQVNTKQTPNEKDKS